MTLFQRKKSREPYSNLQVKKIPSAAVLRLVDNENENKIAQSQPQQITQDQDHKGLTISITIILR